MSRQEMAKIIVGFMILAGSGLPSCATTVEIEVEETTFPSKTAMAAVESRKDHPTPTAAITVGAPTTQVTPLLPPIQPTGSRPYEVLFTTPAGENGLHYEGVDQPERFRWGPTAFTLAPDDSFWIVDGPGQRLMHFDTNGALLGKINYQDFAVGVSDVHTYAGDIYVLDSAAVPPKLFRLSEDGKVLASYGLPESYQQTYGLLRTFRVGEKGEIIAEYAGSKLVELVDAHGQQTFRELDGYIYYGRIYRNLGAGADPYHAFFQAGDDTIEIAAPNQVDVLDLLSVQTDGSFCLLVQEVWSGVPLQVDLTVRCYTSTAEFWGIARVPLADQFVYVEHSVAAGVNGNIYALLTQRDFVELLRLNFFKELYPILPPAHESVMPG
jgi:hypothetical protein